MQSVWPSKKSSAYSRDSYLLSSSMPTWSINPSTGAKLVPMLCRTTAEGRMNSSGPLPFLDMPAGNAPSNAKPTLALAPGAIGSGRVST